MKAKLIALGALVLILTGCSSISSGYITAKKYTPDYYYTTMQCVSYSAKGFCTVQMPVQHYVSETFKFDLRNDNKDTGWVYVSEYEYNSYEIGDYYGEKD